MNNCYIINFGKVLLKKKKFHEAGNQNKGFSHAFEALMFYGKRRAVLIEYIYKKKKSTFSD